MLSPSLYVMEIKQTSTEPAIASQAAQPMSMDDGDPEASRQPILRRERIYGLAIIVLVVGWLFLLWLIG